MDRFTDSFILIWTRRCFNTIRAFKTLLSIVGGRPIICVFILQNSLLDLISKIAAVASYKKVVKSDGKIAIK